MTTPATLRAAAAIVEAAADRHTSAAWSKIAGDLRDLAHVTCPCGTNAPPAPHVNPAGYVCHQPQGHTPR